MKNYFSLVFLLLSFFFGNAQKSLVANEIKIINHYLSLEKSETGSVFKGKNGNESTRYDYVQINGDGFIETTIIVPLSDEEMERRRINNQQNSGKCGSYYPSNDIHETFHVFELMQNLKLIDFSFDPTFEGMENGRFFRDIVNEFGCVSHEGKFALVRYTGEFVTDFKYDSAFNDANSWRTSYTKKGKKMTVFLDKFSGKELFETKDSIVHYWNTENFLVKNTRGKYYLTYEGKRQKVNKVFRFLKALPIESSLFTINDFQSKESGFYTLNGNKVACDFIPYSNFYKGHCIVVEEQKDSPEKNYYGELNPERIHRILKIVNENFETVKILSDVDYLSGNSFNRYGQLIVTSKRASSNHFVIDYTGNVVIPSSIHDNRLKEIYDGLYELTDYAFRKSTETQAMEGYYNQTGEKLAPENATYHHSNLKLVSKKDVNYLTYYGQKVFTLDKENKVIEVR